MAWNTSANDLLLKLAYLSLFEAVLISRINSWASWFIFNPWKNKQVSHAPNTRNRNSAFLVIQFYKQYYEFVVSHSYVLEQLVSTAPREWVHLCLAHRIDWHSFPSGVAILPPAHSIGLARLSWAWLAPISIADLSTPGRSHNHTNKFSYSFHMRPKLVYTYTTLQAHDILHIHTYEERNHNSHI
jgi:hypothetical protein